MKTIITINKPCTQRWDNMQGTHNGKFCELCQKNVTDFTSLTDNEIHRLTKNANGNLCGRFLKNQINRPLVVSEPSHITFRKFFLGLSLATIFNNTLQAFTKHVPAYYQTQSKKTADYNFLSGDSLQVLKVTLMDSATKESIPFANIVATCLPNQKTIMDEDGNSKIIGPDKSIQFQVATTDIDGNAQIKIPKEYKNSIVQIKAVYVGYQPTVTKVDLSKTNAIDMFSVQMYLNDANSEIVVLGGIGAYYYEKPTLWTRIKNVFRRKN